ncbi:unnamed protein product, partial [Bemisia tabaci]
SNLGRPWSRSRPLVARSRSRLRATVSPASPFGAAATLLCLCPFLAPRRRLSTPNRSTAHSPPLSQHAPRHRSRSRPLQRPPRTRVLPALRRHRHLRYVHVGFGLERLPEQQLHFATDEGSWFGAKHCTCTGGACLCCLDFNISYIDLGGPGCVNLKYLSQQEGMMVNVSYGGSLLHSEKVKGSNPEPACMDLLADLVQICARFSDVSPTNQGLRGCVHLEPSVFGEVQTSYSFGCFNMGADGMVHEKNGTESSEPGEATRPTPTGTTKKPDGQAALLQQANESAEQSIAWFSNLLGFSLGSANATEAPGSAEEEYEDEDDEEGTEESTEAAAAPQQKPQRRTFRSPVPVSS